MKKKEKNRIYLDFCIKNFEGISHDDITKLLNINPTTVHIKGHRRNPNNNDSPLIKANNWFVSSGLNEYLPFEDHLNALLAILEAKVDVLKPICEKYHCEFICAIYIYHSNGESTPWLNLGERYNKLISKLNIAFDLDLYVYD